MAGKSSFPLELVIKAVDKATGPLAKFGERLNRITSPAQLLSERFSKFAKMPGVKLLGERFAGVGSAIGRVGHEVGALAAKLVGLAAVAGFGFFHIVKGAVDAGDKLSEMAQRVGLSVDAYAQLQFAAAQADVDQEQFNSAMDQFNKRLGEAKAGSGPLLQFLEKVSPALAAQVKGAKGTEAAFSLMVRAFEKVQDPAKRAALAAAVFGKSGLQMGQFLGQGSKALSEQRERFRQLAGPQQAAADGASKVDNAFREAETAFLGLRTAAVTALYPAITKLATVVADFLAKHRDGLAKWATRVAKAIEKWVDGGGIDRLVEGFKQFFATVDPMVQKLGGWPVVIGAIAAAIAAAPLLASLATLAASLVSLVAAFGAVGLEVSLFVAGVSSAAYMLISNWSGVKGFFLDLFASLKRHFGGFNDFVAGVFTLDFQRAWQGIKDIIGGAKDFIVTAVKGLVALMKLSLAPILAPLQFGMKLAGFDLNPERAAPPAGGAKSEAKVTVNFENAPRGMRALQERISNGAPIDMSVGYAMVMP
jgi:hypothetical protein